MARVLGEGMILISSKNCTDILSSVNGFGFCQKVLYQIKLSYLIDSFTNMTVLRPSVSFLSSDHI